MPRKAKKPHEVYGRKGAPPSPDDRPLRQLILRVSGKTHRAIADRCDVLQVSINTWIVSLIERELETTNRRDEELNPYLVRHLMRIKREASKD